MRILLLILALLLVGTIQAQSVSEGSDSSAAAFRGSPTGCALSALAVATGVASTQWEPLQECNRAVRRWNDPQSHGRLHVDNILQYLPAAGVYGLKWAGVPAAHDYWAITKRMVGTYSVMALVTVSSKYLIFHEVRPDGRATNSFPSGHTATAFAGAEMLRLEFRDSSPWIGVAGYAVATATGCLRVYNDRHWAGDVLAGAGVGFLSAQLSYGVNSWLDSRRSSRPTSVASLPSCWL